MYINAKNTCIHNFGPPTRCNDQENTYYENITEGVLKMGNAAHRYPRQGVFQQVLANIGYPFYQQR